MNILEFKKKEKPDYIYDITLINNDHIKVYADAVDVDKGPYTAFYNIDNNIATLVRLVSINYILDIQVEKNSVPE